MLWLLFNVELPSADRLRDIIDSWGWAAWLVFIGSYALVAMTPIPVTVMAVTAGLLFGVFDGTVLSVIGVLIGCWAGYWLARGLGRQVTIKMLGSRAVSVERHLDQAGLEAIIVLRLLPGFPYWPVNYGSGAFGVGQRDFLVGSALAVIPGQFSLVSIGAFISNPSVFTGTIVAVSWAIVLMLTVLAYWRWKAARPQGA
ncbi:MAG TPA: VTT domain-containing protein [Candidatus Yaniella excrementavium]|nr:VTT domain-containing protein [Candidatus Yaniella excrementavium]